MLEDLLNTLAKRANVQVIAIDGFGGAGKSTLANLLLEKLPRSTIIRMDDYIIDKKLNNTADLIGFDRSTVINEISKAKKGSAQLLIIEGISSLHPDLDDYVDFKIWVNTTLEEANQRARARDVSRNHEYLRYIWDKSARAYLEKHTPHKRADFLY